MTTADLTGPYLDLLARALTFELWDAGELAEPPPPRTLTSRIVRRLLHRAGIDIGQHRRNPLLHEIGLERPRIAHSMIGLERMAHLRGCVEDVLRAGVPGDLIETGVWRGGATIFMRGLLRAYDVTDRLVWVADSFEGLPTVDATRYPADAELRDVPAAINGVLGTPLARVKAHFERYGLLDDQVRFLPGWFRETLPRAPIERLAVARLDGDLYESTTDALTHLYPKLSPGGHLIVDDYGAIGACRQAVEDYRKAHQITAPLTHVEGGCVSWKRS
jgi:O-methyltransferase